METFGSEISLPINRNYQENKSKNLFIKPIGESVCVMYTDSFFLYLCQENENRKNMLPQTLKTYIETAIIPRYEHFDKAHNLSHVQTVMEESMALCKLYPETNPQMVYTIAAYHDLGLCKERETHHLISGEILMADKQLRN